MNDLVASHVVLVDPTVIVNVHVFVLAVMVLLVARLVSGLYTVMAIEGTKSIIRVVSLVVLPKPSFHLIYTVLVPFPDGSVQAILELQVCRLVGEAESPNATCTHHALGSVAQVVLRVTLVLVVLEAPPLMINNHDIGAVPS